MHVWKSPVGWDSVPEYHWSISSDKCTLQQRNQAHQALLFITWILLCAIYLLVFLNSPNGSGSMRIWHGSSENVVG